MGYVIAKDDDIGQTREDDEKRFAKRKAPDRDELKRMNRLRATFYAALKSETLDNLEAVMREYDWDPRSDEWKTAVKMWRKRHGWGG